MPPVLRSHSCFQIKGAVDWQCLWLSETPWESRVVRNCCRRGEEADKGPDSIPCFIWRASQSPAPHDLSRELQRVTADAGSQREGDLVLLHFLPWKICFCRRRSETQSSNLREGILACSPEGLEIGWSGACHEASLHWSFYLLKLG